MPSYKFDCFKKGHLPMDNIPQEPTLLDGYLHMGCICRKCKVVYYEQISNQKVEPSSLVDLEGKHGIIQGH